MEEGVDGRAPQGEHPGAAAAQGQLCLGSRGAGDRIEHEEGTVGQFFKGFPDVERGEKSSSLLACGRCVMQNP